MIRKDADRPHGDNWVCGDRRLARRNVTDHPAVGLRSERELGNEVARVPLADAVSGLVETAAVDALREA